MDLEHSSCYRAVAARDHRFDGQFFSAVKTTGVFCRPICPSRTPKRHHVEFYRSAAAAHRAGFRPCLRCRPEVAPFSAAWMGTEAIVARAMRMIDEGALDEQGLEEFAERLGVTGRHLRRLFNRWVGASPLEVAWTRRALFAKSLITDTRLPMTTIAHTAGFGSVRRFNDALQKLYHCNPTELRRGIAGMDEHFQLRVPVIAPYRWDLFSAFLKPRLISGLESLAGNLYKRRIDEGILEAEWVPEANAFWIRLPAGAAHRAREIIELARGFFDTRANPKRIAEDLAGLIEIPVGIRVPGAWEPLEMVVRAVLGQQISVVAATELARRVYERCGKFTPERLLAVDLIGLGLSARQQFTIREAAERARSGNGEWAEPGALETIAGIGPWTSQYVEMRLGHADCFPVGDLYLKDYGDGSQFRPWGAYAAMAVWMQPTLTGEP